MIIICTLGLTYWSNVIIVQSNHHTRKVFVVTFNFLLDLIISFLQPRDISLRNSRRIPVYSFPSFVLKCLLHIGHKFKRLLHSLKRGRFTFYRYKSQHSLQSRTKRGRVVRESGDLHCAAQEKNNLTGIIKLLF